MSNTTDPNGCRGTIMVCCTDGISFVTEEGPRTTDPAKAKIFTDREEVLDTLRDILYLAPSLCQIRIIGHGEVKGEMSKALV